MYMAEVTEWSYRADDVVKAFLDESPSVSFSNPYDKIEQVGDGVRLYAFYRKVNAVVHATPCFVNGEDMWRCDVWLAPDEGEDPESTYLYLSVLLVSEVPVFSRLYSAVDMGKVLEEDIRDAGRTPAVSPGKRTLFFLWRILGRSRAEYNTKEITERADGLVFYSYYDEVRPDVVYGDWEGYWVQVNFKQGEAVLCMGRGDSEAFWDARIDFLEDSPSWDDMDEKKEVLQTLQGAMDRRLTAEEFSAVFPALIRRLDYAVMLWVFSFTEPSDSGRERSVGVMAHTRTEAEGFFKEGHGEIPFQCSTEASAEPRPSHMPVFALRSV